MGGGVMGSCVMLIMLMVSDVELASRLADTS